MSIFGDIKDTLFGGTDDSAQKKQIKANDRTQEFIEESRDQARSDVFALQPYSDQAFQRGYQSSADMYGDSIEQQLRLLGDGNYAAQQQLLAGMPQYQNAILGNPIDNSALQPVRLDTSTGMDFMFNPQMPDLGQPTDYGALLGGGVGTKDLSQYVQPGMTNAQLVAKAHSEGLIDDKDYKMLQNHFEGSGTGDGMYWASTGNAGELITNLNSQGKLDNNFRTTMEDFFNLLYPDG